MRIKHIITGVASFWIFAIFYSTITISERQFEFGQLVSSDGNRSLLLIAGPILLVFGMFLFVRYRQMVVYLAQASPTFPFIFAMFVVMLFNGAVLWNHDAILYTLLFAASVFVLLYVNWIFGPGVFWVAAISVTGMLLSFIVVHGFPVVRWIGGIHPNHIGAFALLATFFAARSEHLLRWMLYLIAISFAILVSSRYAMVAIAMIVFADHFSGILRLNLPRAIGIVLLFTTFSLALLFGHEIIAQWLAQWLALHDSARGIGSGFVGRAEMWSSFVPQILERPFTGFGFRQKDLYIGTHNGFLNFALENGLIVSTLFLLAILAIIKHGVARLQNGDPPKRDTIVILASWGAWAFAAFFQPQLVNFGDAFGIMTVFLLTAHVRWVMSNKKHKQKNRYPRREDAYM